MVLPQMRHQGIAGLGDPSGCKSAGAELVRDDFDFRGGAYRADCATSNVQLQADIVLKTNRPFD